MNAYANSNGKRKTLLRLGIEEDNPGSSAYKQRIFCALAQECGCGKNTASKEKLSLRQAMRKT